MTELEQAFIDAFHRVDDVPIPSAKRQPSGLADGMASGPGRGCFRTGATRLLAVAAALAVVAGIVGISLWQPWRPVPAVPAATPRATVPVPTAVSSVVLGDAIWLVVEVAGAPAVTTKSGELPYLEFDSESMLVGGPCDDVAVEYRQEGSSIRFALPESRPRPCSQTALAAQQEKLWSVLEQAREVVRADAVLRLLDADGVTLLVAHDDLTYGPQPTATPSAGEPEAGVYVAIRNDTGTDFNRVQVNFGDEWVDYGPVPAGGVTGYASADGAYPSGWIQLTNKTGETMEFRPDDHVGDSPLPPGRHIYALYLHDGQLDIRVE